MKKLIIALLASVLLAAGFVGATGTAANAAQCDRYGVCIQPTGSTNVPAQAPARRQLPVKLKLDVPGDAVPQGTYKQIIERIGGVPKAAAKGKVVSKKTKKLNNNGAATIYTPKLAPGRYKITLKFIPKKNTPWERVNKVRYLTVR